MITKTYGDVYEARRYPCAIMHNGTKDAMHDYEGMGDRPLKQQVHIVRKRKNLKYDLKHWRWAQGNFWPLRKQRSRWL